MQKSSHFPPIPLLCGYTKLSVVVDFILHGNALYLNILEYFSKIYYSNSRNYSVASSDCIGNEKTKFGRILMSVWVCSTKYSENLNYVVIPGYYIKSKQLIYIHKIADYRQKHVQMFLACNFAVITK